MSWQEINCNYPKQIANLFRKIVDSLRSLISGCNLLVVGSFSNGTARYLIDAKEIRYFSDIDLLLVVPDNLKDILKRRDVIFSRLHALSSCLKTIHGKFHVGLRYRFNSELPDFALKCESLGYQFNQHALTLYGDYSIEAGISKIKFNLGHIAENFCSKIWTVIKYVDLDFSNKSSEAYYLQAIERAKACMDAIIKYSNRKLDTNLSVKRHYEDSEYIDTLDNRILEILTDYSSIVQNIIIKNNANLCLSASKDEEFDFFRVSNKQPEMLGQILFLLLEIIKDFYLNKKNNDKLSALCEYANKMNLGQNLNLEKNAKNIYYFVRYNLAQKRVLLSPLFKRDRGTKFLTALKRKLTNGE